MCVTDRHDMTLAGKVALNPNTTNQPKNSGERSRAILARLLKVKLFILLAKIGFFGFGIKYYKGIKKRKIFEILQENRN